MAMTRTHYSAFSVAMSNAGARLLIVDDEQDTCSNLSDIFTDLGYQVDVAYDGPMALDLFKTNRYTVALLDLKMPGMDGLELYRRIRQISAGTVAIVVTAFASSNTTQSVLDAGAWKILPKPVKFPQLLELVGDVLSRPLILVVDDDQELCDSLCDLFRQNNYRVCLARHATEAAGRLKKNNFHVVLIDLKLPGPDGNYVLEQVKHANPRARSVVITGHRPETEPLVDRAIASGAAAVCYKPLDVPELLATVSKLCGEVIET